MKVSFTNKTAKELYNGKLEKAYAEDAGYDLRFCGVEKYTADGMVAICHLGVKVELVPETFGLLVPRSSLVIRRGLMLANSVGIIDSGYHGEVKALLFSPSGSFNMPQLGERIVQLLVLPVQESLRIGAIRGSCGFGSSGA